MPSLCFCRKKYRNVGPPEKALSFIIKILTVNSRACNISYLLADLVLIVLFPYCRLVGKESVVHDVHSVHSDVQIEHNSQLRK